MRVIRISLYAIVTVFIMLAATAQNTNQANEAVKLPAKGKLAGALVMFIGNNKVLVNEEEKIIDSKNGNVKPILVDNVPFIPLSFTSLIFNKNIEWSQINLSATVSSLGKTAVFTVESKNMELDGHDIILRSEPFILNKRFYIPLDSVALAFGKKVFYNNGLIVISNTSKIFDPVKDKEEIGKLIAKINYLPTIKTLNNLKNILQKVKINSSDKILKGVSQEEDFVRASNGFIYQIFNNKIYIIKATPAEEIGVVNEISFKKSDLIPEKIYLEGTKLIVIGSCNYDTKARKAKRGTPSLSTKILLYDVAYTEEVKKIRELEIAGQYINSKFSGTSFYFTTKFPLSTKYVQSIKQELSINPTYRDSAINNEFSNIELKDINIISESFASSIFTVGGFNLEKPVQPIEVSAFLGGGGYVYFSNQNLYLFQDYKKISTNIYKYVLSDGKVNFAAKTNIPGFLINNSSIDEFRGDLRIASVIDVKTKMKRTISSNIFILDDFLNIKTKILGIGEGEMADSIVFTGNRCYIRTNKYSETLYSIDLMSVQKDKAIGKMDITGFDGLLMAYDDYNLIGFSSLQEKMGVFDFTDKLKPTMRAEEFFGEKNLNTVPLIDSDSVLLKKDKDLLVFPVKVQKVRSSKKSSLNGSNIKKELMFQGVYIYNLSLENGFNFLYQITHITDEEISKKENDLNIENSFIKRILMIDDNIYSISKGNIKINSGKTNEVKGELRLK